MPSAATAAARVQQAQQADGSSSNSSSSSSSSSSGSSLEAAHCSTMPTEVPAGSVANAASVQPVPLPHGTLLRVVPKSAYGGAVAGTRLSAEHASLFLHRVLQASRATSRDCPLLLVAPGGGTGWQVSTPFRVRS